MGGRSRRERDAGCRILLVRHGETTLNVQGRFRGREDPPLDAEGRREAASAAQRLDPLGPLAIYSSPRRRARQTAEALALRRHLPVQVRRELDDLDYGAWTGWTPAEASSSDPARYRRFRADPESVTLPGGERVRTVRQRAERLLRRIADRYPGGTAVAVTHDVPIRLIVARARRRTGPAVWEGVVPTGSITPVLVEPQGIRLLRAAFLRPRRRRPVIRGRRRPERPPRRRSETRPSRAGRALPRRARGSRPRSSRRGAPERRRGSR
jgi:broad specificity phosphatase PhoE